MNLIIDRGNTLVKVAVYEGHELIFVYRAPKVNDETIQNLFNVFTIDKSILSSVAEVSFSEEWLADHSDFIKMSHVTQIPFKNLYATPETLGRDRIAAVTAAITEFPNRNLLVIDTGTCLTIDFVNAQTEYLGGNISPGPRLRYEGMHHGTSALPLVEAPNTFHLIGTSTETALQSGGYGGCIAEIIGWIALAREQFEDLIVVLSGGDAEAFATSIKNEIFVRPDLILRGLNEILQFNANKT